MRNLLIAYAGIVTSAVLWKCFTGQPAEAMFAFMYDMALVAGMYHVAIRSGR